ncbi:DUF3105 domain-containing protein [Nocardioides sp. JQ2195]|uniref:DUF3105 domain-containing protein n=1 Tax=Nocardioides sp. JQ2195 TaxID=2592334 RepID=UPI00143E846D|nr:DUF3105 domain-containing protein [Nocardioides sp. JQ2195]QIX26588.1 DUF3105 domain-containing protein [Nocardioides sp. JQ2195]
MNAVRLLIALIVATVVVGGALLVPLAVSDDGAERPEDITAVMGAANGVDDPEFDRDSANLSGVKTYETSALVHVAEEVDYQQSPPVGGKHDPVWAECGVYDRPVREENAVHALEHGTVWITYRSDLSGDDVDTLTEALPDEGILSPYDDQEAPVVVTVWNTQLALDGADDPRLALFIDTYGHGETAPEPMASCHGGVTKYEDSGTSA